MAPGRLLRGGFGQNSTFRPCYPKNPVMQTTAAPRNASSADLDASARTTGERIFALMDGHPSPGIFSKKGAYARMMEWSMKDPAFKAQLFRFVDVLPSLESSSEIVRHLQEYLGDKAVELNPALRAGLAASSFASGLVAGPVKSQIVDMALRCQVSRGGRGPDQADPPQRETWHRNHDRPPRRNRRQRRGGGCLFETQSRGPRFRLAPLREGA